jgi:dihydroxyacetone kinase
MNKEKVYALYKGDDLLEIGTKKELAEKFGVKAKTIAFYNTPAYQKRTSAEKGRRLVMLD